MNKIVFTGLFLILTATSFSQKNLTQAAINDFATISYYKYKYGDGIFKGFIDRSLVSKGWNIADIAIVMENLKTNVKGRDAVLYAFYNVIGLNKDQLFQNIYSMGVKATTAKEISTYIYDKYVDVKDSSE